MTQRKMNATERRLVAEATDEQAIFESMSELAASRGVALGEPSEIRAMIRARLKEDSTRKPDDFIDRLLDET